jgi:MAX-like protein X
MQDFSFEDDLMNLGENSLFSFLTPNNTLFPSARELNRSGFGPDCIQPSLSQLQPPIDMEFEDFFSIQNRFSILPTLPEEPQNEVAEQQQLVSMGKSMSNQQQSVSTSSSNVVGNVVLSSEDVSLSSRMNNHLSTQQQHYSSASFNSHNSSIVSSTDSPMIDSSLNSINNSIMDYQVTPHTTNSVKSKATNNQNNISANNHAIVSNNSLLMNRQTLSYVDSTSPASSTYASNHHPVVSSESLVTAMYSMPSASDSMKQQQQQYLPIATSSGLYQPNQAMHIIPKNYSGIRLSSTTSSSSQGQLFSHPPSNNVIRGKNMSRVPFERSSSLPLYQNKQQQQNLDSYSSVMNKTGSAHHVSSSLIAQLLHNNSSANNQTTMSPQQLQVSSSYHPLQPQTYSSTANTSQSNLRTGYRSPAYPTFVSNTPSSPPFVDSGINTLSPTSSMSSPSMSMDSPTSSPVIAIHSQHKPSTQHHRPQQSRPHSVRFAVDDSQAYSSSTGVIKKETPVRKISSPARICSNHPAAQQNIFKEPQSPVMSPTSSYSTHQRMSPKSPSIGIKKGVLSNLASSSHHHPLAGHASPTHTVHNEHHHHDKTQYKEHRRVCHINAEQKRRCNIKNGFDTLRQILPSVSQNTNTKISKAAMLAKAAEHIRQLKHDSRVKMEECDRFKGEIDTFNQAIRCVSNKT